ncbi:MAG: dihydrodipicolinate synthase family protein, partial [Deltaproteobacteria bacterium]|nr:dihydrodipicolinate synthase family protein [Deltaproteobacteria bacterium]
MEKTNSQLPDGVFAATLTPLTKDLSIDHYSLILHMKGLLANGCDGIGFMGTTGEATSFSVSERIKALEAVLGAGIAPRKLLVGTGCAAFSDAVALTFHAVRCGVGGVLVLPPFYYKGVSDEGLFRYYAEIIERTSDPGIRIYLYHFPKMTALPLSEQLIGRLLKAFPGIVAGIKDSGGDWNNMKLLTERFPGFRVYAGTERFLLDILQTGGPGCISATTNITSPMAA